MAHLYNWGFVAHRRALIDAVSSVILVLGLSYLYIRGSGVDLSWIVLAAPVLLYHAWVVFRQARAFRDGDRHGGKALALLTGTKIVAWVGLTVWAGSNQAWGWLAVAVIMVAVKVGELGIYLRALRAAI